MRNEHTVLCERRSSNFGEPDVTDGARCVTNEAGQSHRQNVLEQTIDESECSVPSTTSSIKTRILLITSFR